MSTPILRAYYKKIFFQFILRDKKSDAIIILPGFPSSGPDEEIMYKFNNAGFNVFFINYPGSFQSKGSFLESNPVNDITEFIDYLNKGKCTSLWDQKEKTFSNKGYILVGSSFGGAIACGIASKREDIKKLVLFSPVLDFNLHDSTKEQNLEFITGFVKRSYQNIYRIKFDNLVGQLKKFKELSSKEYLKKIKIPVYIFHNPNDKTVFISHSRELVNKLPNSKLIEHDLGHGISNKIIDKYMSEIVLN